MGKPKQRPISNRWELEGIIVNKPSEDNGKKEKQ